MKQKLPFSFLLILFFSGFSFGQMNEKFWIKGKVIDSADVVQDVHVLNLNSKKGTFTNEFGDYKIVVAIGDTLRFSSVSHQTVKRIINKFNYTSEVLDVFMPIETIELEEFELKRHNLSGFLSLDTKKTPIDRRAEALKNTMDFSKVDMSVRMDDDFIDSRVRPPVAVVDPTKKFVGIGTSAGGGGGSLSKKELKIKELVGNPFNSRKVFDLCGEEFFEKLKIPKEKVFDFIDYCKQFDISELYNKDLILELAIVLEQKAPQYLKTLKQ